MMPTALTAAGAPLDRDALVATAGVAAQLTANLTLGLTYCGPVGARAADHAVRGSLTLRW